MRLFLELATASAVAIFMISQILHRFPKILRNLRRKSQFDRGPAKMQRIFPAYFRESVIFHNVPRKLFANLDKAARFLGSGAVDRPLRGMDSCLCHHDALR